MHVSHPWHPFNKVSPSRMTTSDLIRTLVECARVEESGANADLDGPSDLGIHFNGSRNADEVAIAAELDRRIPIPPETP